MRLTQKFPRWVICGMVLSLAACAERPIAVSPFLDTQQRWETAAHWQSLAEQAADGLVASAERGGFAGRAFHIRAAGLDTAFGQAFEGFLATALVSRGMAVAPAPARAVVVNVAAQPVARPSRSLRSVPGAVTGAVAVGLGAAYVADGWPGLPEAAVLGGLTGLVDAALMSQPTSEVIVTVSVMDDTRYLYRLSQSYYVRQANLSDYVSTEPPAAPFTSLPAGDTVSGESAPTRRLAVVGPPESQP